MLVLVCPRFICLSSQHSLDRIQLHSFFQLLTRVLCRPFLPIDRPGLLEKHRFYFLNAYHSHVHRHLPFKQQIVPLWSLVAQIARVSRMTAPACPLACFNVYTSTFCTLQAFCCSLPPSQTPSAQPTVASVESCS